MGIFHKSAVLQKENMNINPVVNGVNSGTATKRFKRTQKAYQQLK